MYNLMVSEIFMVRKSPQNAKSVQQNASNNSIKKSPNSKQQVPNEQATFELKAALAQGEDPLENYRSLFDPDSTDLYTSIRNLFTLSFRGDIIKLIANIENFKKFVRQQNKEENQEKVNITRKHQALFESGLLKISREVYSPIAKVIGYNQLIRSIIPNFDFIEGDQIQDCIYELTLNL